MSQSSPKITIVGAGVAGLSAALAMAQAGLRVEVLEQSETIREHGAGLQISPNGAVVLQALGLGPALEAASRRAEAVELRDGLTDALVTRLEVGRLRPDQGWHFLHRGDLIALLAQAVRAAGVELRLLQKVDHLDLTGPRPILKMCTGAEEEAEILLAADGLHSPCRKALNGNDKPFFTKQVAWRCLVPATPDEPSVAEVHMGPGRHLVSYPLQDGHLRNIVAVEERDIWTEEGWSHQDRPEALQRAFAGFSPRVQNWLHSADQVWLWGLYRHPVAEVWGKALPAGAVALLGDAAHPTLPFLAQGANMALEDAYVLREALVAGLGANDLASALKTYQNQRRNRCARIVEAANGNARNYHLTGPKRWIGHQILRFGGRVAPGLALSRFNWLYDHDVTQAKV